mgnify:CR=1 FL=1
MSFQISPGVNVTEIDLTTIVPTVSTTDGAIAGLFNWGPVNQRILVDNEQSLATRFGKPPNINAETWFTASSFLSYGNNLSVVRAVGSSAYNATGGTPLLVKNSDVFQASYLNQSNGGTYGGFIARYPGTLGNSLKVSVCDNSTDFATWTYKGYFTTAPGTSNQANDAGGSNDEMHIAVIDNAGVFTGTIGTVLETFAFISKASDAVINGVLT